MLLPGQTMPATSARLPRPLPSVVYRPVSDGAVLLSMRDETYFGLNAAGRKVWEMLASDDVTSDSVVAALAEAYPDVARETLHADFLEIIAQLREHRLVQVVPVVQDDA